MSNINFQLSDRVEIEAAAFGLRGRYVVTKVTEKAIYIETDPIACVARIGFWAPKALFKAVSENLYSDHWVVLPTWFKPYGGVRKLKSCTPAK